MALVFCAGVVSAGCATEAYASNCNTCSFSADGKVDSTCSGYYTGSASSCYIANYPNMSVVYNRGNCTEIDACKSQLASCVDASKTGDDRADCSSGVVTHCFAAGDACMAQANAVCSPRMTDFEDFFTSLARTLQDLCSPVDFILFPALILCVALYERKPAES